MDMENRNKFIEGLQVFISSKTSEMETYRNEAIKAIHFAGMRNKNFNAIQGTGATHGSKTIFDHNRDTVKQSDIFVGLYGFSDVWRPASDPQLITSHRELLDDPEKLIMEYEYEWAQEAGLHIFRYMRTYDTSDLPFMSLVDYRMDQFRLKLRPQGVRFLTNPLNFYNDLLTDLYGIRPRIFLSYSRKNLVYATDLQQKLRNEGLYAWRDATNIPGGEKWAHEIEAALEQMDVLVVILTSESANSEWVEKECLEFIRKEKPVIPYIADPKIKTNLPAYLSEIQYVDGTLPNEFSTLVKRLRAILKI